MSQIVYQQLRSADDLGAWEPRDGHAIVTCRIRIQSGAYDAWEPRTYEFEFARSTERWLINTNPGYLPRDTWDDVVEWLYCMQPIDIELVTTV